MRAARRVGEIFHRLRTTLGAPGLMIAGFSAVSFAFGLFVLSKEYDQPREIAVQSARRLLEDWVRSPDYLGLTLVDYVDLWRVQPSTERTAALDLALARLGDDLDGLAERLPMVHVRAMILSADGSRPLSSWRSSRTVSPDARPATDRIAMTPPRESPRVWLWIDYRLAPSFAEGVNALETAYLRVLLALLGLSGFSLLCLGYLILHTRALSERVAREAAREATLDLADRTCHELGNGVFVLANERRNLTEHLDLVDRFIAEESAAREAAARRLGIEPAMTSRWEHALRHEYASRGIDPDLELRASSSVAREVCRQIGACASYIGMTVRELDSFLKRSAMPVTLAPTPIVECFEEAVSLLWPRIGGSGVEFSSHVEGGETLRARADHRLLIHALVNLLKNAIEAVSGRMESPRVELLGRGEGGRVLIEVRDNGPGLDPEARRRVFDSGFSTKGPGRGRGLAIVRDSIHAQGGEIELIDSQEGGAIFRITLGLAPPSDE